ncbi:dicarboxylate/amino acid:cation symporter [Anaerorhabdus sp.]|uniref:dicarboxylate/amino acid:cation symporter n=1 Tax=Anaerorhabdus sp. TaxID=1872524 RepID=UPI002B208704|nr:dicarboxylate/amino acid:cation symporter [Anaerorhabdus sp.]MEA4874100.1 dicarboxylate/amino acid:cation symporter [Anaerorhabdus sp.]
MKKNKLAIQMFIGMICGLVVGGSFLFLRENLLANGNSELWTMINNILFVDISQEGATQGIGILFIIGQLFVNALQIIIVPMVFTSIVIAMCRITDTKKLGRISYKTILLFAVTGFIGILFAGIVGMIIYNMGYFNVAVEGLNAATGSTGSNPLNVFLGIIPNNLLAAFSSNGKVLSVVFVAVVVGFSINVLNGKVTVLKKICEEVNEIITIFLTFVITKFGPFAIFALLTRTFAIYGVEHLRPALTYVVTTVLCLLIYLIFGYASYISLLAKLNPIPYLKKITKVSVFGFSTSSSAATLPMNIQTTVEELGVKDEVASFVLPLGMTVNMNGTAIMQVIATIFIAASAGYQINFMSIIFIGALALIASVGTPAAPGAGAVILFTVLSGMGFTNDAAILAYSLILAINRPIEMLVTSLNVVGDSTTAIIVAKSENLFDEDIYNS